MKISLLLAALLAALAVPAPAAVTETFRQTYPLSPHGTGRFTTVNGSIKVAYASLAGVEQVRLGTVNGSCRLTLSADTAFELDADSTNGGITSDFPVTLTSKGRRHLRGRVNGSGPRVELDSVNGSLVVRHAD